MRNSNSNNNRNSIIGEIVSHLSGFPSQISRFEYWWKICFVRIQGKRPTFVSKEIVKTLKEALKPKTKQIAGLPISFGKTLNELLERRKTCTRRNWKDSYARTFINYYENDQPIQAFDRDRRYGGKSVGLLRLTEKPHKEKLADMPLEDLAKEGFPHLTKDQFINRFFDGDRNTETWVIRFEFEPHEPRFEVGQWVDVKDRPELWHFCVKSFVLIGVNYDLGLAELSTGDLVEIDRLILKETSKCESESFEKLAKRSQLRKASAQKGRLEALKRYWQNLGLSQRSQKDRLKSFIKLAL